MANDALGQDWWGAGFLTGQEGAEGRGHGPWEELQTAGAGTARPQPR